MNHQPFLTLSVLATNRSNMRYLLGALVVGSSLVSGVAPAAAQAQKTWAVFDSRRAIESTTHFKDAKAAMEKALKGRQDGLEVKKKQLEGRREEIEAKKAVSSSATLKDQERQLLQEQQTLAQEFMKARQELGLYEQKLKEQLFARLELAVREVAILKENTFVVDAGRVLYYKPAIDITEDVVAAYNRRFGDKPLDLSKVELSQAPAAPAK